MNAYKREVMQAPKKRQFLPDISDQNDHVSLILDPYESCKYRPSYYLNKTKFGLKNFSKTTLTNPM